MSPKSLEVLCLDSWVPYPICHPTFKSESNFRNRPLGSGWVESRNLDPCTSLS